MRSRPPRRRTLIGREAELGACEDLLEALGRGETGVVFLAGEPGIGKTALVAEVLERGRERGYRTLSGRAAEFESDLPFAVFADSLERPLRTEGRDCTRQLGEEEIALLGIVFPSLVPSATVIPTPRPDDRHRLLRALRALLESLANGRPLVLALDDLHWADAASIDLVCHLLHRGIDAPTLFVLASRPAQSQLRLLTALEEAERRGLGRRVELAPLSSSEAEELIGAEIDPVRQRALYRESGGNPFYLEQLAAAESRGAVLERPEQERAEGGVPAAVSAAIRHELETLPEPGQTLLRGAAVLGEPFEPDLAADVAGMQAGDALTALDGLLASDLIRPTDDPRRFRFRHPIVHRAVYEAAGGGWRITAHERAAATLAARGAPAAARAHHVARFARMGDGGAIAVLVQAGEEAASRAPASAARWLDAALRLIPDDSDNLERRLALLGQRAGALGMAGRLEESREALRDFLQLSPPRPDPLRLQAVVIAAIMDELLGSQASARKLLEDELARLPDRKAPEAAELERELAFACFFDADWAAMARSARRSLAAQAGGMVRVGALSALGLAEYGLGDIDRVRQSVSAAAELFDALGDDQVAAHHPGIAIWLGWSEVCTERFDDAIRHLERSIAISRASGQRHLTVGSLAVQGQALALKGEIDALVEVAEAAVEAALLSSSELFMSWALTVRCQAAIQTGDLHGAVGFGERGVSAGAGTGSPLGGLPRLQLAAALLEIGEAERAREQLVTAQGRPDPPPFPLYGALFYELLARAELVLGHPERADALAASAEEAARTLRLGLPLAHAHRARALVLLEGNAPREAAAEALASRRAADQAGAPIEAARSRTLAGSALAAAGERDAALAEVEAAHAQLSSRGALRYRDEAARELRKLGRHVPRPGAERATGSTLGLTERELEVMKLVAAGKKNREIARELFLSVRTVDTHVARIFDKLGVSSRAGAASLFERARGGLPK